MIRDIRQHLNARPFVPFVIVMSSGQSYPVPTSEHAALGPEGNRLVLWFDDGSRLMLSGLHITSVEDMPKQRVKKSPRKSK